MILQDWAVDGNSIAYPYTGSLSYQTTFLYLYFLGYSP